MKAASSVLAANINSKYWQFKKKRSSDFPRWQCTKSTLHNFHWPFCLKTCNNFIYWFPSVCSRDPLIPLHAMLKKKKKENPYANIWKLLERTSLFRTLIKFFLAPANHTDGSSELLKWARRVSGHCMKAPTPSCAHQPRPLSSSSYCVNEDKWKTQNKEE